MYKILIILSCSYVKRALFLFIIRWNDELVIIIIRVQQYPQRVFMDM